MRIAVLLLPLLLALGGCAAPPTGAAPAGSPAPAATPAATPTPAPAPAPAAPVRSDDPAPVAAAPGTIDRSCRTDADCVVKDVGSCCGYQPACVNTAARPDPAAVKAQCQARGMSSTCGFQEISACTCSAGQCVAAGDAPMVR